MYSHLVFPINFFQKYYKLGNDECFLRVNNNLSYILQLVFEDTNYVVLEIGFGQGDFLIQYALDNPEHKILGIEKSENLVKEVCKKLERKNINNVRLINAKAEFAVYFLIPNNFIDKVIINFPDPWPKKAHINRRLVNSNFLALLYNKMKTPANIWVSTDVESYKDFIIEAVEKLINRGFRYKINHFLLGFWDQQYQTKYLKKWLKQNKKIFSIEIVKY